MPLRSIVKLLCALLLATFVGVGSGRPAQASIVDCLNALIPVGSALKLVGEAADPEFLQCSAQMSTGDPIFMSTVGLVIGAGAAGAFNSEATCQQMTTGQIGKLIAEVLTNMGTPSSALKSLLGEDGYKALVNFAASESASNIATETPSKSIFEYMSCGCTVYGKATAAAEVATSYIGDVTAAEADPAPALCAHRRAGPPLQSFCCCEKSDQAAMKRAAMSGPRTNPLMPKREMPPTVEISTT